MVIFSTSLPPAVMASSLKALELIMKEPQRVQALRKNVQYFCQCLREAGIEADSITSNLDGDSYQGRTETYGRDYRDYSKQVPRRSL